jgi:putative isomerase
MAGWGRAVVVAVALCGVGLSAQNTHETTAPLTSRTANGASESPPRSASYQQVQQRLARGWNTWDVHSVTTHVQLPGGLAIHVGMKHNTTEGGDAFLGDALIGRQSKGAEVVTPGPHSWDGSYTDLRVDWEGHNWRIQSAHEASDLVLLATPLASKSTSALPPTIVFSVNFLWNQPGAAPGASDFIQARGAWAIVPVYCACNDTGERSNSDVDVPVGGAYFAVDFTHPVGISTGRQRDLAEIEKIIDSAKTAYMKSIADAGKNGPIVDAIETTLGWDTIYDPEKQRVISPVSRVWSVGWGGYVLFDWDTFFAATLASIGDKDLAYANAIEILRESTAEGFVPNYARAGEWKSSDRSEPPVGAITVLGLYRKFHDRWFIDEAYQRLLAWNRWWAAHRDIQGYLAWGSDGDNQPANLDDDSRGARQGAIFESGLDNSPMYDAAVYNAQTHFLEYGDVGLMSMYIADCDALVEIADVLEKPADAKELRDRGARYRAKLATMWNEHAGIFLNKDLNTGQSNMRLSPTNFYPMLAHAATPEQAKEMLEKHLLNNDEFWGEWVIPSIARNDAAFHDQEYWRGRIWGPMNYLVYLGLENYDDAEIRRQFAEKSYSLFLKEWGEKGHVHENYNAILGTGDDVSSSDRFYHWGALLGYVEFMEQNRDEKSAKPVN